MIFLYNSFIQAVRVVACLFVKRYTFFNFGHCGVGDFSQDLLEEGLTSV